jgi:hypothetical protein
MNTTNAILIWLTAFLLAAIVVDSVLEYRRARKQFRRNRIIGRVLNG